jgi:hypothetical protein
MILADFACGEETSMTRHPKKAISPSSDASAAYRLPDAARAAANQLGWKKVEAAC